MRVLDIVLMATLVLGSTRSWAECRVAPSIRGPELSAETLKVRGAVFMSLCSKSSTELVDANDTTMQDRIVAPKPDEIPKKPNRDFYPSAAIAAHIEGKAVLVVVVEADGHASQLSLIQSTGNKDLDKAAISMAVAVPHWQPGLLDGTPTRMLVTFPVAFNIRDIGG